MTFTICGKNSTDVLGLFDIHPKDKLYETLKHLRYTEGYVDELLNELLAAKEEVFQLDSTQAKYMLFALLQALYWFPGSATYEVD